MPKIRVQLAPEIELKMEVELCDIEELPSDYDLQQQKACVYKEFERRLSEAFPEGVKIYGLEFGLDRGWHEGLAED
jgi:hypothetical protein